MKKILFIALLSFLITGNVYAGPGLCRVTTAPPSLITGKDVPCSMDLNGNTRVTLGTTQAGEDVANDVQKVEQRFAFQNITLAAPTTTVIKSGPGFLHLIQVNKTTALGVITCYNNTAASGAIIATITQPAATQQAQVTLFYDVAFSIGLTCVTATAAQDITVSYR